MSPSSIRKVDDGEKQMGEGMNKKIMTEIVAHIVFTMCLCEWEATVMVTTHGQGSLRSLQ